MNFFKTKLHIDEKSRDLVEPRGEMSSPEQSRNFNLMSSCFKRVDLKNDFTKVTKKKTIYHQDNMRVQQAQMIFWADKKRKKMAKNRRRIFNKRGLSNDNAFTRRMTRVSTVNLKGTRSARKRRASKSMNNQRKMRDQLKEMASVDRYKLKLESQILSPTLKHKNAPARHFDSNFTKGFKRRRRALSIVQATHKKKHRSRSPVNKRVQLKKDNFISLFKPLKKTNKGLRLKVDRMESPNFLSPATSNRVSGSPETQNIQIAFPSSKSSRDTSLHTTNGSGSGIGVGELLHEFEEIAHINKSKPKSRVSPRGKFNRIPQGRIIISKPKATIQSALTSHKIFSKNQLNNKLQRMKSFETFIKKEDSGNARNSGIAKCKTPDNLEKFMNKQIEKIAKEEDKKKKRIRDVKRKYFSSKKPIDTQKNKKKLKADYNAMKKIRSQIDPSIISESDRIRLARFEADRWIMVILSKFGKNHQFSSYKNMNSYGKRLVDEEVSHRAKQQIEWKDLRYNFYKAFSNFSKLKKKSIFNDNDELVSGVKTNYNNFTRAFSSAKVKKLIKRIEKSSRSSFKESYIGSLAYTKNMEINRIFSLTYPNIHPENMKIFLNLEMRDQDFEEKMKTLGITEKRQLQDYRMIYNTMKRMIQETSLINKANYFFLKMIIEKWKKCTEASLKGDKAYYDYKVPSRRRFLRKVAKVRRAVNRLLMFSEKCCISISEVYVLKLLKRSKVNNLGVNAKTFNKNKSKLTDYIFEIIPSNNFKKFYESLYKQTRINKFARNSKGQTFLHYALLRGSPEMIGNILSMRLDIDALDNENLNLLDYAIQKPDRGKKKEIIVAVMKARFDLLKLSKQNKEALKEYMKSIELESMYKFFLKSIVLTEMFAHRKQRWKMWKILMKDVTVSDC